MTDKVIDRETNIKNGKKYKALLSDTFIFAIGNFLIKIINFLLMPLYTQVMSTAEYGIADLINNTAELMLPIATICISDAVFRFSMSDDIDNKKLLTNGFTVINIGAGIVFILGLIISSLFKYKNSMLLVGIFIFKSYNRLFSNYTRGTGKPKLFVINGIIGALSMCGLSYLFLYIFHLGIYGYCLAIIISNLICSLFLVFTQNIWSVIKKQNLDKQLMKTMILYGLPLIPNALSWWFTNISSRYIILGFYDESVAGLYSAASKLPALINLISNIFQQAWQFSSTKEYENDNDNNFYENTFLYYNISIVIFSSLVIIFMPFIARVILKNEFYTAWVYVPLLIFSAAMGSIAYFFGTFFVVAKKNLDGMITTVLGAFTNVLFSLILIPTIGIYGASISNVISYIVISVSRIYLSRRYVKFYIRWDLLIVSFTILLIQSIIMSFDSIYSMVISFALFIVLVLINLKTIINLAIKSV